MRNDQQFQHASSHVQAHKMVTGHCGRHVHQHSLSYYHAPVFGSHAYHQQVFTAGGGAANGVWTAMREAKLGVPVLPSPHMEAAYGTALLAMRGFQAHEANKSRPGEEPLLPGLSA